MFENIAAESQLMAAVVSLIVGCWIYRTQGGLSGRLFAAYFASMSVWLGLVYHAFSFSDPAAALNIVRIALALVPVSFVLFWASARTLRKGMKPPRIIAVAAAVFSVSFAMTVGAGIPSSAAVGANPYAYGPIFLLWLSLPTAFMLSGLYEFNMVVRALKGADRAKMNRLVRLLTVGLVAMYVLELATALLDVVQVASLGIVMLSTSVYNVMTKQRAF